SLAGSPAYDLMSLVEDARRDIDPALASALRERYEAAFPGMDRAAFGDAFSVLAAQRHAKVIGIFTRLWRRDGKANYLVHVPRVWRLLERALEAPVLAPVAKWFEDNVPPEKREKPDSDPEGAS
ncbi:MAG: aminoglycoside phosphotransferase, partial [Hydrogenovibrio crunogenus]|nr:aminoglycoside phosphotransferase [Hydrogenovibrio crunogenus]